MGSQNNMGSQTNEHGNTNEQTQKVKQTWEAKQTNMGSQTNEHEKPNASRDAVLLASFFLLTSPIASLCTPLLTYPHPPPGTWLLGVS